MTICKTINADFTIESTIYYDTDLAAIYFGDFYENACGTSANETYYKNGRLSYIVLFEDEEAKGAPYYKKSALQKMRKAELEDLWATYIGTGYSNPPATKAALIEDLMTVSVKDYYNRHFAESLWYDLDYDYVAHGYSQGDAVKVLDLSKSKYWPKNELQQLLYDTPVSGRIYISPTQDYCGDADLTIYLEDYLPDNYHADIDRETLTKAVLADHAGAPYYDTLRLHLGGMSLAPSF